jgi:hypothetical protein
MLRYGLLIAVTAFIWFVVNDGPAVTKSTSSPDKPVIFVPVKLVATGPQDMIFAQAQTQPPAKSRPTNKSRPPARITVYSYRNMVRHCVDWYAEERRPSGTVVVPHMRCRWVVQR